MLQQLEKCVKRLVLLMFFINIICNLCLKGVSILCFFYLVIDCEAANVT